MRTSTLYGAKHIELFRTDKRFEPVRKSGVNFSRFIVTSIMDGPYYRVLFLATNVF